MDVLKYVKNQTKETADIFLFAPIGAGGIEAQAFVNEINFLDGLGLQEINVRINSSGGSVLDGFGIFSAIRNAKTTVNTHVEGIAASIAGIIAMAGQKRTITDFGRLMIHDPLFAGGAVTEKQRKVLDTIKASIITILTNNSSLDEGEVFDLMTEETWFNSEEALAFGFIDEIVSTKRTTKEVANWTIEEVLNLAADTYKQVNNQQTQIKMLNVINHLGLTEGVDENEVLDAVKALETKVTEAEVKVTEAETKVTEVTNALETLETEKNTEIETLNNSITEKDTKIASLEKQIVTTYVENAITEGKLKAEDKEALIEKALNDFEGFKLIVNSVNNTVVKPSDLINRTEEQAPIMTFTEMSKKAPEALLNMMKNDPEAYKKLYKDEFGKEPKI